MYLVYILIYFLVSVNAQITISISIRYYKTKYLDHNGGCRCIDTCEDALLWEGAILSSNAGKSMISFIVKFFIQRTIKYILVHEVTFYIALQFRLQQWRASNASVEIPVLNSFMEWHL